MTSLFAPHSVGLTMWVFSLTAALGLALGHIRWRGLSLGVAGVMFVGLFVGYIGVDINPEVLDFIRDFGLILFVFTIGLQVGPGFFTSLKKEGLPLNALAAAVVLAGAGLAALAHLWGRVELPVALGLFSGATTNTPSLAAAQQVLKELPAWADLASRTTLGYATAYPFGILGIILAMFLMKWIFRVNVAQESQALSGEIKKSQGSVVKLNLEVRNPNMDGMTLKDLPSLASLGIVVSRVMHDNVVHVARASTVLHRGDVLLAVGPREDMEQLKLIVGGESPLDLTTLGSGIDRQVILVTRKSVSGKTLRELDFASRFGVVITRINRGGVEFAAGANLRIKFGDTLLAVGEGQAIARAALAVGNSPRELNIPQMIPIFVGMALGVLLGSIPLQVPGFPAALKLGLAGGPLVAAIILGRMGQVGPLVWYMPVSANMMLRELGISLFLVCVGLKSGPGFVSALVSGQGFYWMAWGAVITLLPLLVAGPIARLFLKTNYVTLCGLLSGSMTDPPALAFANAHTHSDGPAVAYAAVYPLVMLLRVLLAQVLVFVLSS